MNEYEEMRNRHQQRFNEWANTHMFFAFDKNQFRSGMQSLGLDPDQDTDKIYRSAGGGFYKKTDAPELKRIITENWQEFENAMNADPTGDGFIFQAFYTELCNHEYSYTGDPADALDSLNLEPAEVRADPRLLHGLQKAQRACIGGEEE